MLKICDKCGRQYFPNKFTPYQRYCRICKGKSSRVERKLIIPDDVKGLYITGGKAEWWFGRMYEHVGGEQYWAYGKGFYRPMSSQMVMKAGEEIGILSDIKEELKKVLKGELDEKVLVA